MPRVNGLKPDPRNDIVRCSLFTTEMHPIRGAPCSSVHSRAEASIVTDPPTFDPDSFKRNLHHVIRETVQSSDRPLTAPELCEVARLQVPRIALSTVRRAVQELATTGSLRHVATPANPHALNDPTHRPHRSTNPYRKTSTVKLPRRSCPIDCALYSIVRSSTETRW